MRRERGRVLLLVISLLLHAACHSSPEKKLQKVREKLASWDATAQLTRELSRRGALPQVYVHQVSEAVYQGREQARQQAAEASQ
jgi:hypothetical protein